MQQTTIQLQTHEYINTTPYKGCKECGFSPGSIIHNTTQKEWKVSSDHYAAKCQSNL